MLWVETAFDRCVQGQTHKLTKNGQKRLQRLLTDPMVTYKQYIRSLSKMGKEEESTTRTTLREKRSSQRHESTRAHLSCSAQFPNIHLNSTTISLWYYIIWCLHKSVGKQSLVANHHTYTVALFIRRFLIRFPMCSISRIKPSIYNLMFNISIFCRQPLNQCLLSNVVTVSNRFNFDSNLNLK